MATLLARLQALEARRRAVPAGRHGVFIAQADESPADALARARREGYGSCLVSYGVWELGRWLEFAAADGAERQRQQAEIAADVLTRARPQAVIAAR